MYLQFWVTKPLKPFFFFLTYVLAHPTWPWATLRFDGPTWILKFSPYNLLVQCKFSSENVLGKAQSQGYYNVPSKLGAKSMVERAFS
jgi:hypothetical protein